MGLDSSSGAVEDDDDIRWHTHALDAREGVGLGHIDALDAALW